MKFAKRLLMVFGSVALAGLIGVLFTPKLAHAVVATLVEVANDTAHPVPTLATDATTAFAASSTCAFGFSFDYKNAGDVCGIEPLYTVPAGKTAVLESASGVCVINAGTATREFQLQFTSPAGGQLGFLFDGNNAQVSFPPSNVPTSGSDTLSPAVVSTTSQSLRSYASGGASGTPINFYAYATANQFSGTSFCTLTLSGHLQ